MEAGDPFSDLGDEDHILGFRLRLVGVYRGYAHALLALRVLRRPRGRRWRWVALAAWSLSLDVLLARRAASAGRPLIAERAAIETLEAAVWTRATGPLPSTTRAASLLAMPTSAEAGYLLGRAPGALTATAMGRALVPMASVVVGQGLSRRSRGWTPGWGQIGWGIIGIAMGAGLGRNRRAVRARYRETWREHAGPRVEAAFWCAQHDLTMDETDPRSPHNLKKDLLVLEAAGSARARSARFRFSERKEEVVSVTAPFGAYLGDLSAGRQIVPSDAWSVRLSPAQARYVQDRLRDVDASRPDTTLPPVALLNVEEARRPGGRIELSYGEQRIEVPEVSPPERWLGDPAPVLFVFGAVWKLLGRAFPEHPPFPVALVAASIDLLAAGAYKQAQPGPADVAKPIMVAFASAMLFSVPTGVWMRRRLIENNADEQGFPMSAAIFGFTAIAARYWDDLDGNVRRRVVAGTAGLLGLMWLTSAHPIDVHGFVTEVLSMLLPVVLANGFSRRLSADSDQVWELLVQRSEAVIAGAYRRGGEYELRLLAEIIDQAEPAIDDMESVMSPDDRILIRRHFEEARQWLVEHPSSSSSSKTNFASPS